MLEKILEIVEKGQVISVQQLADKLNVSEDIVLSQIEYLKHIGYIPDEIVKKCKSRYIGCSMNCPGCAMSRKR